MKLSCSPASGKIYILGHSAGGPTALYCTADLLTNRNCADRIFCLTGASPRPGDSNFAEYIDASQAEYHRNVNGSDMVPSLPPEDMGFSHPGKTHRIGPPPNPFYASSLLWVNQHFIQHYCDSLDRGLF